jgi:hypothetical protein
MEVKNGFITNGLDAMAYIYNMFRTGETPYELFAGFSSKDLRPVAELDTVEQAEEVAEITKEDFGFTVFELRDTKTSEVVKEINL